MRSRRQFILAGAPLTAAAFAGCSNNPAGSEQNNSSEDDSKNAGEEKDTDSTGNGSTKIASLGRYAEVTPVTTERPISIEGLQYQPLIEAKVDNFGLFEESSKKYFGADASEMKYLTKVGFDGDTPAQNGYQITEGRFSVDTAVSELAEVFGGGPTDTYRGFQMVETRDLNGPVQWGVSNEVLVRGNNRDRCEFGIDVLHGDRQPLAGDDSDFETALRVLDNPDLVRVLIDGEIDSIPGDPAVYGVGFHVAREESEFTAVATYEAERETVDREEPFEEEHIERRETLSDVETEASGDSIITTGTVDTSEIIY